MPAAIDVSANAKGAAYFAKKPAWHGLGTVVDTALSSEEVITTAGMDIELIKIPLFGVGPDKMPYAVPGLKGIQRTDTKLVLSVVSDRYTILQNRDAFKFMDSLAEGSLEEGEKLTYESAGMLDEGRRVWLLAHSAKPVEITQDDVVESYALLSNSHDGSSGVKVLPTGVRVVCANTLSMALTGFKGKVKRGAALSIRHSENMSERINEAKRVLGYFSKQRDKFAESAKELVNRQITKAAFKDFAKAVVATIYNPQKDDEEEQNTDGASLLDSIIDIQTANTSVVADMIDKSASDRRKANAQSMLDAILLNYDNPRQTLPGIAGTAWAAYNSVTEYVDHGPKNYRGDERQKAESRMKSITEGQGAGLKATALELIYQTMMT